MGRALDGVAPATMDLDRRPGVGIGRVDRGTGRGRNPEVVVGTRCSADAAAPYSTVAHAASERVAQSASACFTAWLEPIGRSNWTRVFAYSTARS